MIEELMKIGVELKETREKLDQVLKDNKEMKKRISDFEDRWSNRTDLLKEIDSILDHVASLRPNEYF